MTAEAAENKQSKLAVRRTDSALTVVLAGPWSLADSLPDTAAVVAELDASPPPQSLNFATDALGDWDSSLVTTVAAIMRVCRRDHVDINIDLGGLPKDLQQLLKLAFAIEPAADARRGQKSGKLATQTGMATLAIIASMRELLTFTGMLMLSLQRWVTGRAKIKRDYFWLEIQQAGAEALPIVGMISLLMGMIFAFVGVMELSNFGAGIYTADLVAVAMVREMGPIMTAIIMAGRTGASYAAQLGTMKVNEEIDALTTLGINPMDFLVLPRFIALVVMVPLLTVYADVMGIVGGALVAIAMLDVSLTQYLVQTNASLAFHTLFGGLFKALVYGGLVALAGTQQGMACGNSAMAVGQATTRAVVTGIVLIVVSAAVLTIIYVNMGI